LGDPSQIGGRTVTKGALGSLLYVLVLEYGFYAVYRLFPKIGTSRADLLFVIYQAVAIIGITIISRFLPGSRRPAFTTREA